MSKRTSIWRRLMPAICAAALAVLGMARAATASALNYAFTAFSPDAGSTGGNELPSSTVARCVARLTAVVRARQPLEPPASLLGGICYVGITGLEDMPRVAIDLQRKTIGGPRHDNDLSSASPAFCPV